MGLDIWCIKHAEGDPFCPRLRPSKWWSCGRLIYRGASWITSTWHRTFLSRGRTCSKNCPRSLQECCSCCRSSDILWFLSAWNGPQSCALSSCTTSSPSISRRLLAYVLSLPRNSEYLLYSRLKEAMYVILCLLVLWGTGLEVSSDELDVAIFLWNTFKSAEGIKIQRCNKITRRRSEKN